MRYQNFRLVLHRPRLLTTTVSRTPSENLAPNERTVVEKCRKIASQIVIDVERDWFPIQLTTRNSVWFLFQACMVPLLSLFSDADHEDSPRWKSDIETSLRLFKHMSSWSLTDRRTYEVVQTIYDACRDLKSAELPVDTGQDFSWDALGMDTAWDGFDWGSVPGMNDFSFDTMGFGAMDFQEFGGNGNPGEA